MSTSQSTDLLVASAVVQGFKTTLNGLIVGADGTNAATVTIYDNATAASGKILAQIVVPASSRQFAIFPIRGVQAFNGLYCSISGTGASAQVYFGAA